MKQWGLWLQAGLVRQEKEGFATAFFFFKFMWRRGVEMVIVTPAKNKTKQARSVGGEKDILAHLRCLSGGQQQPCLQIVW